MATHSKKLDLACICSLESYSKCKSIVDIVTHVSLDDDLVWSFIRLRCCVAA